MVNVTEDYMRTAQRRSGELADINACNFRDNSLGSGLKN